MKTGLLSVTFRNLSIEQIVKEVKKAKLDAIEWGGDIHVPHGDLKKAKQVRKICEKENIETPSYGSYFRAGENMDFLPVLETAIELNCHTIRIWAGKKNSELFTENEKKVLETEIREICRLSGKNNINIALEFHSNTITNTNKSTVEFLNSVGMENLYSYWQTALDKDYDYRKKGIEMLGEKLSNIHVFNWEIDDNNIIKKPLEESKKEWKKYLKIAKNNCKDLYAMLEFVKDDSVEQMYKDAQVLRAIKEELRSGI